VKDGPDSWENMVRSFSHTPRYVVVTPGWSRYRFATSRETEPGRVSSRGSPDEVLR
jgi:hypothetical protein